MMGGRRPAAAGAALLLILGAAPAAAEAPCGTSGRAVVELVLEIEPPDRFIGTTLERHLRAELGAREIDVCIAPVPASAVLPPPAPPVSRSIARVTLRVEHQASGAFIAIIRVADLITDKRVERTVDLARIPADGRPLAVAVSTDELLRASWAELTMPDAPPPAIAPPPAVVRAVTTPVRPTPARPSRVEVGLVATGVDFLGHRVGVGGEAWVGAFVLPRLALQLRFSADTGLARSSRDGSARADTLGAGLAVAVPLVDHDAPLGVRLEAGAEALRVHLVGTTSGPATVSDGVLWTGLATATVRGWARTGPVSWTLGLGAVAALHAVAATDNGATVTSIEGFGAKIDAGLACSFR